MREVEIGGYQFKVREESMADVYKAMDYTRRCLLDIEDDAIRNVAADRFMAMLRISEWSGPKVPDECTTETKDRFFARRPGLLFELGDELRRLEQEDQKNSEPSQDG